MSSMETHLVVAGYIIHENKVLLVNHKKLDKWLPPGGHIEKNETPDDALKREIKEELNLEIKILNRNEISPNVNTKKQLAVPFYVNVHNVGDHDHCCFFYLCTTKSIGSIELEKLKIKSFSWFSIEDLRQKHIPEDVRDIGLKAFDLYGKITVASK